MIKNPKILKNFEDSFISNEGKLPFDRASKLFTSMWNEALKLGVLPSKDPWEGIDVVIRIAKVLNSCSKKPLY